MTVSTLDFYRTYIAAAGQTVFPYPFKILAAADLKVYVDGSLKVLGVDYTVSGAGAMSGGNVTFLSVLVGGEVVLFRRETARTQSTDLAAGQKFYEDAVEAMADRLTMIVQEFPGAVIPFSPGGYFLRQKADQSGIEAVASMALGAAMPFDTGAAPPTSGTWAAGFFRFNTSPAPGVAAGWYCEVGGTPGTWYPISDLPWRSVTWHGASPAAAGATNVAAVLAAIAAASAGDTVIVPPGTYSINSTITIDKAINFIMQPGASFTMTGAGAAIDVTAYSTRRTFVFDVSRTTDWTAGNTGIQMEGMMACDVTIRQASGFETGFYIRQTVASYPTGNIFRLGTLWSNRYAVRLNAVAGAINQNGWYGGYLSCAETVNPTLDRAALYIENSASGNVFHGIVIAYVGNTGSTGKAYGMLVASGNLNRIVSGTVEGPDYILAVTGANSQFNSVDCTASSAVSSLAADVVLDSSTDPTAQGTNVVRPSWNNYPAEGLQPVFQVDDIHRRALVTARSGSDVEYAIPGFTFLENAGGYQLTIVSAATDDEAILSPQGFRFGVTLAIGRLVDCSVVKDFWAIASALNRVAGDITLYVKAYDAGGVLLTGGDDIHGGSNTSTTRYPLAYAASKGGSYAVALSEIGYIHAGANVASMWIGVGCSETDQGITGLAVFSPGSQARPHSSPGYDLVTVGAYCDADTPDLHASVQPIGGVLNNGTRIWHLDAATGEATGWWVTGRVTTAANGGEPAAETVVAVDDITGITNGDLLGVLITDGTTTKWHWTTVNGAPAAGNVTMTHAVPAGWAIADGAKVISYRLLALANLP